MKVTDDMVPKILAHEETITLKKNGDGSFTLNNEKMTTSFKLGEAFTVALGPNQKEMANVCTMPNDNTLVRETTTPEGQKSTVKMVADAKSMEMTLAIGGVTATK